jgi:hypothetical protein
MKSDATQKYITNKVTANMAILLVGIGVDFESLMWRYSRSYSMRSIERIAPNLGS